MMGNGFYIVEKTHTHTNINLCLNFLLTVGLKFSLRTFAAVWYNRV